MKIYLEKTKFLDVDLSNWMKTKSDAELEVVRQLFDDFIHITGEIPVYSVEKGRYSMLPIVSSEIAFNEAIELFGLHYGLDVEKDLTGQIKDISKIKENKYLI